MAGASATTAQSKSTPDFGNDEYGREHSSIDALNDEEPAVSGWGGDEEDGMGML